MLATYHNNTSSAGTAASLRADLLLQLPLTDQCSCIARAIKGFAIMEGHARVVYIHRGDICCPHLHSYISEYATPLLSFKSIKAKRHVKDVRKKAAANRRTDVPAATAVDGVAAFVPPAASAAPLSAAVSAETAKTHTAHVILTCPSY